MDPETQVALSPWAVALNLPAMARENAALPSAEVIPPPDGNGVIEGRDGRRYRMKDAAALAARINGQEIGPRIDFDHRSERSSPTFAGSTAAEGWLKNARPNARGGIDADLGLSSWAAMSVRSESYRYLSPALFHTSDMEITGLSSVGLVNDPNFNLPAPTIHSQEPTMDEEKKIAEREKALETREKAANERALNAATRNVDQAVADGKIQAAAKEYHLGAIKAHKGWRRGRAERLRRDARGERRWHRRRKRRRSGCRRAEGVADAGRPCRHAECGRRSCAPGLSRPGRDAPA